MIRYQLSEIIRVEQEAGGPVDSILARRREYNPKQGGNR
jgi:hypothetical protein